MEKWRPSQTVLCVGTSLRPNIGAPKAPKILCFNTVNKSVIVLWMVQLFCSCVYVGAKNSKFKMLFGLEALMLQ